MRFPVLETLVAVCAIAMTACSSGSSSAPTTAAASDAAAKAPAGPPEPISAKDAYWKAYMPAHAWSADIVTIGIKSGEVSGVKNADGKAGLWTIIFASPAKRQMRTYDYAVADQLPDITKGVREHLPDPWGGPAREVMPFESSAFSVDSDAAYKTAAAKAADWLKEKDNATKPVSFNLGSNTKYNGPVWAILFGTSKSGYLALVNATTGEIVSK